MGTKGRKKGYGHHPFLYGYIKNVKCQFLREIGLDGGENAEKMVKAAMQNFCPKNISYWDSTYLKMVVSLKRLMIGLTKLVVDIPS